MKLPFAVSLLAVAAALVGGFAAFHQRDRLAQLNARIAGLEQPRNAASQRSPVIAAATKNREALSEPDKLELMRLRAEVARLRARERELAPLRAENESLHARRAVLTNHPPGSAGGYMRLKDVPFAGQATPEAALQTFLWAIAHADTNALHQVIDTDAAEGEMREILAGGEKLSQTARILAGYRLLEVQQPSPTEAVLKVEILPDVPAMPMKFRKAGNIWRLVP